MVDNGYLNWSYIVPTIKMVLYIRLFDSLSGLSPREKTLSALLEFLKGDFVFLDMVLEWRVYLDVINCGLIAVLFIMIYCLLMIFIKDERMAINLIGKKSQ